MKHRNVLVVSLGEIPTPDFEFRHVGEILAWPPPIGRIVLPETGRAIQERRTPDNSIACRL